MNENAKIVQGARNWLNETGPRVRADVIIRDLIDAFDTLAARADEAEQALRHLATNRRLLAHAKSCPAMFDGDCTCGAQETADHISGALAALRSRTDEEQT